jgi:hypothetical protein
MPSSIELIPRGSDRVFTLVPRRRLTAGRTPDCEIPIDDVAAARDMTGLSDAALRAILEVLPADRGALGHGSHGPVSHGLHG